MDISLKKHYLSEHISMTQRDTAKECDVCLRAVNKILKQKKETGTIKVHRKEKCEKKRKTTERHEAFFVRQSELNFRKTS